MLLVVLAESQDSHLMVEAEVVHFLTLSFCAIGEWWLVASDKTEHEQLSLLYWPAGHTRPALFW